MPFKGVSILNQRISFVKSVVEEGLSVTAACLNFGISRSGGHDLLKRFAEEGADGLADRSRRPHGNSRSVPASTVQQVLECKGRYPTWGPKKLYAKLKATQPEAHWPAVSTIGQILFVAGLVGHTRRRSKPPRIGELTQAEEANDVWCMDFKGQFLLSLALWCFPFTLTDDQTRFLLRCYGLGSTSAQGAWPILLGAFLEYGLPRVLRSDNGVPFAAASVTGLSPISVRLIKLGIVPERIDPGSPQQNGRHERMHRTLKNEATIPPKGTLAAQRMEFDRWRAEYNDERPHEALAMKTPGSLYVASTRPYPGRIPNLEYDETMPTKKVRPNGCLRLGGQEVYIGEVLSGETIGLKAIDDQLSAVYVGVVAVAILSSAKNKLLSGTQAQPYLRVLRHDAQ